MTLATCGRDLKRLRLKRGDCLKVMLALDDECIDSVVCDPPYHLTSVVERFGKPNSAPARSNGPTGVYRRMSKGFMGQVWDGGDIAFRRETWAEVWRVMKPGAHLLAFGGTRTYHRLACAIEDGGFTIRDALNWIHGQGFPKSKDVSKDIDRMAGESRIKIARIRADGISTGISGGSFVSGSQVNFRSGPAITDDALEWEGWGIALKPSAEIICLARKPLSESTVAANVLKHGTGALNIDGCRVATHEATGRPCGKHGWQEAAGGFTGSGELVTESHPAGRWPPNILHDGSPEVMEAFKAYGTSKDGTHIGRNSEIHNTIYGPYKKPPTPDIGYHGEGTVARFFPSFQFTPEELRFFYTSKANSNDRRDSKHPTIKPVSLLRWLCKLITPPGGWVLDPFCGTGTTLEAAYLEGFKSYGIENESKWYSDACRRLGIPPERLRLED